MSDLRAERLYSLNTATWTFDRSLMVQTQGRGGMYAGQCPFYLIEHPEVLVAFDSGISRELVDDPASYGPYDAEEIGDFMPAVDLDAGNPPEAHLDDRGDALGDVDYLVLSHLHVDHAGNIDRFDDAEVVIHHDQAEQAKISDDRLVRAGATQPLDQPNPGVRSGTGSGLDGNPARRSGSL